MKATILIHIILSFSFVGHSQIDTITLEIKQSSFSLRIWKSVFLSKSKSYSYSPSQLSNTDSLVKMNEDTIYLFVKKNGRTLYEGKKLPQDQAIGDIIIYKRNEQIKSIQTWERGFVASNEVIYISVGSEDGVISKEVFYKKNIPTRKIERKTILNSSNKNRFEERIFKFKKPNEWIYLKTRYKLFMKL